MKRTSSLGSLGATLQAALVVVLVLPSAWAATQFETLHKFTGGKDGGGPSATLILDQAGNLYGTTTNGGATDHGAVFELTHVNGNWKETVIYSFCPTDCSDGANPFAGLIFDPAGNLYGTTEWGGNSALCSGAGCGVVFELMPKQDGSWAEKVLHEFTATDGANPLAGLIFDQAGNLYGTTYSGGAGPCDPYGCGVVFQLAPNSDGSWQENVLYSFCPTDCGDGAFPSAGLIFDATGSLYGTTGGGGEFGGGGGTVFQLTPNGKGSWTESVLYSFCVVSSCRDGRYPYGGVVFDQTGNLYGTTRAGGANINGAVFQLTPNQDGSWNETVLHSSLTSKNGLDGSDPYGGLIFDQTGNLYGTMAGGGADGWGVVFKLAPNSNGGWHETVLHAFADRPGALPLAGLTFDTTGNLYGTTSGDYSKTTHGSVFEITP